LGSGAGIFLIWGPFDEVVDQIIQDERKGGVTWESKIPKLFWRGKLPMAPKLRNALVAAAKGKSWSDVELWRQK